LHPFMQEYKREREDTDRHSTGALRPLEGQRSLISQQPMS
jgi:hypothetical protein